MVSPIAIVMAKAAVTRSLIGSDRMRLVGAEAVAGAANGFQRAAPEGLVDLRAQPADVHLDHVRVTLVGCVPGVLQQVVAGKDAARLPHQGLEQHELLARELDPRLTAPDLASGGVEPELADLEDRRPFRFAA